MKSSLLFALVAVACIMTPESKANPLGIADGTYVGSGTIVLDKAVPFVKNNTISFTATRIFKGDLIDGETVAKTPLGKQVVRVQYRLSQDGDNHYRVLDRSANNLEVGSVSCNQARCRFVVNSSKIQFEEDLIRTATGFNYIGRQSSGHAGNYKTTMAPKK